MPFVPVPNTLMVETVWEVDNQVCENTSYFLSDSTWNEGTIDSLLQEIKNLIGTDLIPLLTTITKLVRVVGTLLDAVDAVSLVLNVSPPLAGTIVSAPLPNNVSYVVTFNTSGRGRANRGRNYVVGMSTVDTLGPNQVSAGFRTGILAYYTALRALASENGCTMVVCSRFSGVDEAGHPIPRATGVTRAITSFSTADTTLDSQRRRLPGRGQ